MNLEANTYRVGSHLLTECEIAELKVHGRFEVGDDGIGAGLLTGMELRKMLEQRMRAMTTLADIGAVTYGIQRIAAERRRQVTKERWTESHDDEHESGQLAMAAACYAAPEPIFTKREACLSGVFYRDPWPWDSEWDKRDKHDRKRRLEIAGALIAAELDRLYRAELAARDGQGG